MSNVIEGTIRGKTIELETDPGLADGQAVRVIVQPLPTLEQQRAAQLDGEPISHRTPGHPAVLCEIQVGAAVRHAPLLDRHRCA